MKDILTRLRQRVTELEASETERKQAEEALQDEKNKLQSVVDAMEDGLTIQDRDHNIFYLKEPAGVPSGGRVGDKCYRAFEGRDKACEGCPVEKAFKDGKSHTSERRVVTLSGEVIFWENTANPVRDAQGKIVSCLEIDRNVTERKQAEAALRESEEKYRALVEDSPNLIAIYQEGALKYVNRAMCERLGWTFKELISPSFNPVRRLIPKHSQATLRANIQKRLRGEDIPPYDINLKARDGLEVPVMVYATVVTYQGKPADQVTHVDITVRKQAEEALRESEEKYKTLFDSTIDGLCVIDAQTTQILLANGTAAKIYGFDSQEEAVGKSIVDLIAPEERQRAIEVIVEDLFQKDLREVHEWRTIAKDGKEIWVSAVGTRMQFQGRLAGLISFRDITKHKRAEEALRESQEKLRKMFESVTEGIIVIDLNGVITEVNQRAVEIHGFGSRDELLGRSALELVIPRDRERAAKSMRQAVKGGAIRGVEYTLLKADGSGFPGELSTSVLKDASGNPVGHITISRDITERKQAEEGEKRLQRELYLASRLASVGELAAGVAHEMNNPLTGILGFSQRLLRKSVDKEVRRDLERIHNEAQRAARVVTNLLAFARRREPEKAYSDINDILRMTLDLRAYELKTGNIEVALDLAPDLPEVMVDLHQIQEVFLNIILNAEQAMIEAHGGGKLSIKTEAIEDYIRISFSDDGPGVPAEHLDRLFDPFFTTRGERGGTGLGLSLCHGIVAEHGGRIYARSEAGEGATFFVQFPLTTGKIDESKVVEEKLA